MKNTIWNILEWIDNEINHGIVDKIFDHLPLENKDGSDSIYYKTWYGTSRKFCYWVHVPLHNKFFGDGEFQE